MNTEISYCQTRAALYMTRLLKANIFKAGTSTFYDYLHFSGVSIKELLREVTASVREKPDSPSYSEALEELHQARGWSFARLIRDFNDIIDDHPILRGTMRDCALKLSLRIAETEPHDAESWTLALQKLAEIFSSALNMNISAVMNALHELQTCRLLVDGPINNGFRGINDAVFQIYESPDADPEEIFCAPLKGETLPLYSFNIPREDLEYVTRLMKSETHSPVHVMIYGSPGTGKTVLARHIAYELDRECIVQRGSDLLNCYVGSTEKNIAEVFRRAEDDGAVLVIDEADTFLFSRDMAVHSWEVSQVNEFLTSLEECRCFCICTTNRLKD